MPAGSPQGGQWTRVGGSDVGGDSSAVSDAGGPFREAQNRPPRGTEPEPITPRQQQRLDRAQELERDAVDRVREVDPKWRPELGLTTPRSVEGEIARSESVARQADAHYADLLRARLGDDNPLGQAGLPKGNLSGPRAEVSERDDAETRRGAIRENQSADIAWLNNHNVEQKPVVPGPKEPDYRIDGEIFDNYAPITSNVRNIWSNVRQKVAEEQADNIIINLGDSKATIADVYAQFKTYRIEGLNRLWVIDQTGKLFYFSGGL